jgi:L-asparaginase
MSSEKRQRINPRIIIHGGAGNITRENLPEASRRLYRDACLDAVRNANSLLSSPGATALDVATFAVTLLENNPLFNAGRGAVFTTAGTHELEASVMVSRGYRKCGVGVMNVTKAKNPIKLAREMLLRGELEDGGGAQGHSQLEGQICDDLTERWGLEMVKPSYYWTRRRWDEHRKGLGSECDDDTYQKHKRRADKKFEEDDEISDEQETRCGNADPVLAIDDLGWDGKEYLPQGTVGAVVLDSSGTLCVATSTGGLTNKLPGRIGDTPTLGAGFWAEEWTSTYSVPMVPTLSQSQTPLSLAAMVSDCIPGLSGYMPIPAPPPQRSKKIRSIRAVALSGTGNGDSFLRVAAARTSAAIARFSSSSSAASSTAEHLVSLQDAVTQVAGPGGMLQQSAEDRWHMTGEGEGGLIGIDFSNGKGDIVFDFNCGGMFHAWVDENGRDKFQLYHR